MGQLSSPLQTLRLLSVVPEAPARRHLQLCIPRATTGGLLPGTLGAFCLSLGLAGRLECVPSRPWGVPGQRLTCHAPRKETEVAPNPTPSAGAGLCQGPGYMGHLLPCQALALGGVSATLGLRMWAAFNCLLFLPSCALTPRPSLAQGSRQTQQVPLPLVEPCATTPVERGCLEEGSGW